MRFEVDNCVGVVSVGLAVGVSILNHLMIQRDDKR